MRWVAGGVRWVVLPDNLLNDRDTRGRPAHARPNSHFLVGLGVAGREKDVKGGRAGTDWLRPAGWRMMSATIFCLERPVGMREGRTGAGCLSGILRGK